MSINFNNKMGSIDISDDVIIKTAGITALQCCGVAGMSFKDSIVHMLKKESFGKGIEISYDEKGRVNIKIHIIVNYGMNLKSVGEACRDGVLYRINEDLGENAGDVSIVVEGIRKDSGEGRSWAY